MMNTNDINNPNAADAYSGLSPAMRALWEASAGHEGEPGVLVPADLAHLLHSDLPVGDTRPDGSIDLVLASAHDDGEGEAL